MPFFPQVYLSPEANFLQLLSELDQPQRKACAPRHARPETFTPRFDVTELADAYELYGEVPGLEKNAISIEFSDAQTLVIKGKTERLSTTTPVANATENEPAKDADSSSEKSHNPTVEDEYDETDTPLATPATTATAIEGDATAQKHTQAETPKPKAKFWVAERRVGTFARSFSFEQRIEHDGVEAGLKNGILYVRVPKSQKSKKVSVNVL
jgi:HSP20 family protein